MWCLSQSHSNCTHLILLTRTLAANSSIWFILSWQPTEHQFIKCNQINNYQMVSLPEGNKNNDDDDPRFATASDYVINFTLCSATRRSERAAWNRRQIFWQIVLHDYHLALQPFWQLDCADFSQTWTDSIRPGGISTVNSVFSPFDVLPSKIAPQQWEHQRYHSHSRVKSHEIQPGGIRQMVREGLQWSQTARIAIA